MDCTQINFSLTIGAASFNSDAVISVPAQKFDLGASIFLASENTSGVFGSLFFSLQSSIETAMFHVRDGFERLVVSVRSDIRKVSGRIRLMWRERIRPVKICKLLRVPSVMVMRT